MPRQVCAPWIAGEDLCCEGPQPVVPCDGGPPVDQVFPFSDDDYALAASNILFARTCSLYPGMCEASVWPCIDGCYSSDPYPCAPCCAPDQVRLPVSYPVDPDSVTVTQDGVPFTAFRVERLYYVVRTDGSRWIRNNFGIGGGVETIISYSYGRNPPIELVMAAQELACEMKRACSGAADCKLPPQVRRVARQGLQIDMVDLQRLLATGQTGLPSVDYALMIHGDCGQANFVDPAQGSLGWGPAS